MTVVTYPEPNTAYVVQRDLVTKAGLKLGRDSFIVQATFGTELGPVETGKAQIAVSIEPTISQAVSQGAHVSFSYPEAWGPFLLTGLMTTEDYASKKPEVVQGFVNAFERALRLIHQNPEAAILIGQKYFPEVRQEIIRAAVKRLTDENVFPEHAKVSSDSWKAAIKLRAEVGDIKNTNQDSLLENRFASQALSVP